jgi:small subunit ribosomal protein S16
MRIGAKKRPFYRIVAVDERSKRTGGYLDLLGTYDPMTTPHEIKLKQDKIDEWIKKGAQMSDGFLRIIGKAPQRPPRKPKKEKTAEPAPAAPTETAAAEPAAEKPKAEEVAETAPQEEVTPTEETPVEQSEEAAPVAEEESSTESEEKPAEEAQPEEKKD